jgi:hypothetical protein
MIGDYVPTSDAKCPVLPHERREFIDQTYQDAVALASGINQLASIYNAGRWVFGVVTTASGNPVWFPEAPVDYGSFGVTAPSHTFDGFLNPPLAT